MKVLILAVGRPGRLLADPIREYEHRARRYFSFEVIEVAAGRGEAGPDKEAGRVLGRVPDGFDVLALTRRGEPMTSVGLARYLEEMRLDRRPGAAFIVGGPFGLAEAVLAAATRHISLSSMSLPRDLARLLLAEQIYRAGTLLRGEPYHKGR